MLQVSDSYDNKITLVSADHPCHRHFLMPRAHALGIHVSMHSNVHDEPPGTTQSSVTPTPTKTSVPRPAPIAPVAIVAVCFSVTFFFEIRILFETGRLWIPMTHREPKVSADRFSVMQRCFSFPSCAMDSDGWSHMYASNIPYAPPPTGSQSRRRRTEWGRFHTRDSHPENSAQ